MDGLNLTSKDWKTYLKKVDGVEGYLVPGQEKALYAISAALPENSTIVEIGSYLGKSTSCISLAAPKSSEIYSIDTFSGNKKDFVSGREFKGKNFYNKFQENIKRIKPRAKVTAVKGKSQEIGRNWDKEIDLLFIDGSHIYKDVKKDFELFFPWLKKGGMIIMHDVHKKFPGVLSVWENNIKDNLSAKSHVSTMYFGYKKNGFLNNTINHLRMIRLGAFMLYLKFKK